MKSTGNLYNHIAVIFFITTGLLLIPLIAMQYTDEVVWHIGDFIVAGILLFGTGLTYELISRRKKSTIYHIAVGLAVGASLLLIWVNLAVGVLGSENNPVNLMYGGVLVIGFLGSIITRLQSKGLSYTLYAMALTQMLVPVIAFLIWKPQDVTIEAFLLTWHNWGIIGVLGVNAFFATLFTGSAILFRHDSTKEKI